MQSVSKRARCSSSTSSAPSTSGLTNATTSYESSPVADVIPLVGRYREIARSSTSSRAAPFQKVQSVSNSKKRTISSRAAAKNSRTRSESKLFTKKRLPKDYPFRITQLLLDAGRNRLSSAFYNDVSAVLRDRSIHRYYELDELYGLQSMHLWQRPFCGDPQFIRLIVSIIRKHEWLALKSPSVRKAECLESVKTLDATYNEQEKAWWGSHPVFQCMRRILGEILGPVPNAELISTSARHGPGSSLTHGYDERSAYFKFANIPYSVSPKARDLFIQVINLDPRWVGVLEDAHRRRFQIPPWRLLNQELFWKSVVHDEYNWNRITTVPKDGTKDRPIAIEPAGNIYLQLGIEGVIRDRLKQAGIDLDSQVRNRRLCLQFSKENCGATIDLTNASDTISLAFCKAMLPSEWFDLLSSVRSSFGELPDGTALRYAKMSSMGNATTFVLESLLFYALSLAISEKYGHPADRISVYGDDLLIEDYLLIHHNMFLELSGFIPNISKSFGKGLVRESCGVDAFEGEDIRPVFLKKPPCDDMGIYSDRNRLNRWFGIHYGCSNPRPLDDFFMKYLDREFLIGPESDTEFDGYWHQSGFPYIGFESFSRRTVEVPARDFGARKLMHDLRGSSEGGKFLVRESIEGGMTRIHRVPAVSGYYTARGYLLDQIKPEFCL